MAKTRINVHLPLWRTHSCVQRRVHSTRGEYTRSGRREESRLCTQECVRHVVLALILSLALASVALGQNRPEDKKPQDTGTIRGVVLDAGTGEPIVEADVSARAGGKSVDATT